MTREELRKEFIEKTKVDIEITGVLDHDYTHWLEYYIIQVQDENDLLKAIMDNHSLIYPPNEP